MQLLKLVFYGLLGFGLFGGQVPEDPAEAELGKEGEDVVHIVGNQQGVMSFPKDVKVCVEDKHDNRAQEVEPKGTEVPNELLNIDFCFKSTFFDVSPNFFDRQAKITARDQLEEDDSKLCRNKQPVGSVVTFWIMLRNANEATYKVNNGFEDRHRNVQCSQSLVNPLILLL